MEFHLTTAGAWDVMITACENARRSIDFEQYIVRDDEVGQTFMALLARKAAEGVKVRVVLDAIGSRTIYKRPVMQALKDAGGQVVVYNDLRSAFFRPGTWLPRTHAKLLHVDEECSYLGSMCLGAYMRGWRDTMVRLEDGLAAAARRNFEHLWQDLSDGRLNGDGARTVVKRMDACYVAQNPKGQQYPIYDALVEAIGRAKYHVRLATPYFFPPRKLRDALAAAHRRGVRITLLLSHGTDVPIADRVTRALLPLWRELGYEVLLYQASVMHAKYAVIDDDWATVGSCNFDYLSLCRNREANIILRDPDMVAEVARSFVEDSRHCRPPVHEDEKPISWFDRLMGGLGTGLLQRV